MSATKTMEMVNPTTLLISANVRKEVELGDSFLESIKQHGVLVPIVVDKTASGLEVIDGQRRTLAAVDVGLKDVPVWVTEPLENDQERIVEQLVVNLHRADVTDVDARAAIGELALFEMKAPAIAKRTGLRAEFVEGAVAVATSKAAQKVLANTNINFDTAVSIAEFDEYPGEQKQLLELVKNGRSWDVRSRAQEFKDARLVAEVEEKIKGMEGVHLVKDSGNGYRDPMPINNLFLDKAASKPVDDLPHDELVMLAGDGLCAFPKFQHKAGGRVAVVAYSVKGWEARGLFTHSYMYGRDSSEPATPEEKEALKAERRAARESTKAWVAASALRFEFLQGLVKRKTMPKGWEPLVVGRLLDNGSHGSDEWRVAIALLGLKESQDKYSLRGVVEDHLKKMPTKAIQIGFATWLGSVEGGFEFDRKGWAQKATKAYLRLLEGWGYVLTDVERVAAGYKPRKADAA